MWEFWFKDLIFRFVGLRTSISFWTKLPSLNIIFMNMQKCFIDFIFHWFYFFFSLYWLFFFYVFIPYLDGRCISPRNDNSTSTQLIPTRPEAKKPEPVPRKIYPNPNPMDLDIAINRPESNPTSLEFEWTYVNPYFIAISKQFVLITIVNPSLFSHSLS